MWSSRGTEQRKWMLNRIYMRIGIYVWIRSHPSHFRSFSLYRWQESHGLLPHLRSKQCVRNRKIHRLARQRRRRPTINNHTQACVNGTTQLLPFRFPLSSSVWIYCMHTSQRRSQGNGLYQNRKKMNAKLYVIGDWNGVERAKRINATRSSNTVCWSSQTHHANVWTALSERECDTSEIENQSIERSANTLCLRSQYLFTVSSALKRLLCVRFTWTANIFCEEWTRHIDS